MASPGSGSLAGLLALAMVSACGHSEPFTTPPTGSDQPFDATPPVRLTFNRGPDRGVAWLPDGSGILYSSQQIGRIDKDVCLALLSPTGGRQRQLTCNLTPTGSDSTEAIESPAPTPDGRLAFVALSSRIGEMIPGSISISIGSQSDPATRSRLQTLPYTVPGEQPHSGASQLRWLNQSRLLYLGERVDYSHTCPISIVCQWDTVATGLDLNWLDISRPGASPQRIPGTDFASGVSVGATEDEVYYTLGGDSRVYRQILSTGEVSLIHDFGAAGIARDVHVVGNRMAAIVGGRVAFGTDPSFGTTQWDSGGLLHAVDLQTGTDVTLDAPGLFRRPQIALSGSAIVAEGYPFIVLDITDTLGNQRKDTVVSRSGDLYLFGQP
jgi:hypothetical protein